VISPQKAEPIAGMARRQKLTFPILWDQECKIAQAFGLAFTLPDDLREVYKSFGNDLAVQDGDPSWQLPVPARFVIDGKGIVRSVEADPDYTHRPEPEGTLAALRKVVSG
jgi:peroxiredoxin